MNQSRNFALAKYKTKITCDKISCDGFEVENLISPPCAQLLPTLSPRNIGFIAEGFIRPPVNITMLFPCNMCIENIFINAKVGGVRSNGFTLYTATLKRDFAVDNLCRFDEAIFMPIGRVFNSEKSEFFFYNINKKCSASSDWYPLRHHQPKHLNYVSSLAVRVTSTLNGSAVAIKSIEVWGRPTTGTAASIIKMLEDVDAEDTNLKHNVDAFECLENKAVENDVTETESVPDDFLDSITHEVMSYPILLPCGQMVDQSTLDRHNQEEACWGRPPNDPFTGKPFMPSSRPLPNMPLKMRIDQFTLRHGSQLQSKLNLPGGKTVGVRLFGTKAMNLPISSRLLASPSLSIFSDFSQDVDAHKNSFQKRSIENSKMYNPQIKRLKKSDLQFSAEKSIFTIQSTNCGEDLSILDIAATQSNLVESAEAVEENDHERMLASSLKDAIRTTLSQLPSYTKPKMTIENSNNENRSNCIICRINCNHDSDLIQTYRLQCSHFICRRCLLKSGTEINCSKCKCTVNSRNAVKVHPNYSVYQLNN